MTHSPYSQVSGEKTRVCASQSNLTHMPVRDAALMVHMEPFFGAGAGGRSVNNSATFSGYLFHSHCQEEKDGSDLFKRCVCMHTVPAPHCCYLLPSRVELGCTCTLLHWLDPEWLT